MFYQKVEIWFGPIFLMNIAHSSGWIILIISLCAIAKQRHHKMGIISASSPRCHLDLSLMLTFSNFWSKFGPSASLRSLSSTQTPTNARDPSPPLLPSPPPRLALLISIITSLWYWYAGIRRARAATGGNAPGRADGSHSGGSEEENRRRTDGVCARARARG